MSVLPSRSTFSAGPLAPESLDRLAAVEHVRSGVELDESLTNRRLHQCCEALRSELVVGQLEGRDRGTRCRERREAGIADLATADSQRGQLRDVATEEHRERRVSNLLTGEHELVDMTE